MEPSEDAELEFAGILVLTLHATEAPVGGDGRDLTHVFVGRYGFRELGLGRF